MDLRSLDVFYGIYGHGENRSFHVFDPSSKWSRGFVVTFNNADNSPIDIYPSDFTLNSEKAIKFVMDRRYILGEMPYQEFYSVLNAAFLRNRGLLEKFNHPTIKSFFSRTMPTMISEAKDEFESSRLGIWAE